VDELPDLNSQPGASSDEPPGSVGNREERLAAIRAAVERGLEDIRAGRVADLDAALDRVERLLDEIEAVKRT
jgi:predicted transcriptional regulator